MHCVILFVQDPMEGTESVESVYGPFTEQKADEFSAELMAWANSLKGGRKFRCHITTLEKSGLPVVVECDHISFVHTPRSSTTR